MYYYLYLHVRVAVSALPARMKDRAGGGRASAQFEPQQAKDKERNSDPVREPAPPSAREKPAGMSV